MSAEYPQPVAKARRVQRTVDLITLEMSPETAQEVKSALSFFPTDHPTDRVYHQLDAALQSQRTAKRRREQ